MGAYARAQNVLTDDADRLTLLSDKKSDNSTVSSFAYSVDKTGNRTKLALANGDYAEYQYDQTYQLTREHRKDSQNATLYYNNFRYDAAGNRTRLEYNDGTSTTTTSYLYNTADQLTRESVGATNTTYLYDANGSLTKKDDGTNVHSYKYDARNLMTDYDGPGSNNDSTYRYDAGGRRITKNVNGSKTAYVYDFLNVVADYDGSNQLQATYVTPGLDDNLSVTCSGSTYAYLRDGIGSIRQLLSSDEALQNAYDYEAFGKSYGTTAENVTNRYRFTGREWDAESALYYYRFRAMAAGSGAFVRRDFLSFSLRPNKYAYVHSNPVRFVDPSGGGVTVGGTPAEQSDIFGDLAKICREGGVKNNEGTLSMDKAFCDRLKKGEEKDNKHPRGCCCLCQLAESTNPWLVLPTGGAGGSPFAHDLRQRVTNRPVTATFAPQEGWLQPTGYPGSGTGGISWVTTSHSDWGWGCFDRAGNFFRQPDWRVAAHELCGHAALADRGEEARPDWYQDTEEARPSEDIARGIENEIAREVVSDAPIRGLSSDPGCGEVRPFEKNPAIPMSLR